MNLATIDVGTNTTLLLVARAVTTARRRGARRTRRDHAPGTRHRQRAASWPPKASRARWRCCASYADIARRHGRASPPSAPRRCAARANAPDFLAPAAEILGTPIQVIDGEREAALTFRAVRRSFPDVRSARVVVVDIGGGSTEIVVAADGRVAFADQPAARLRAPDRSASCITTRRRPTSTAADRARDRRRAGGGAAFRAGPRRWWGRRHRHVAGGDGAEPRHLRPRARARLPSCRATSCAAERTAWPRRPRRARAHAGPRPAPRGRHPGGRLILDRIAAAAGAARVRSAIAAFAGACCTSCSAT